MPEAERNAYLAEREKREDEIRQKQLAKTQELERIAKEKEDLERKEKERG